MLNQYRPTVQRIVLCPALHIPRWMWTAGHKNVQKKKKEKKKKELHINTIFAFCTAVVPIVVVGISAGAGHRYYVNPF